MTSPFHCGERGRAIRERHRPIPDDLRQVAAVKSGKTLIRHYGSSYATVQRWLKEAGIASCGRVLRPMPPDFAASAPAMSESGLTKHYRTNIRTIRRWCREAGVSPRKGQVNVRPVAPADFADNAPAMTRLELARHYRSHHNTIVRWLRETGVEARKHVPVPPKPIARPAAHRGFAGPKSTFVSRLHRDASLEGQAADHLRRFCAVYRCTETGRADQRGSHWRYGNAVLQPEELVERARWHGFDPEAWRRVAA